MSVFFELKMGLKHGCVMLPWSRGMLLNSAGRNWESLFADNAMLLAENKEQLQKVVSSVLHVRKIV